MARLISDIVEDEILDNIDSTLEVIAYEAPVNGVQLVKFCRDKWIKLSNKLLVSGSLTSVSGPDVNGFYSVEVSGSGIDFTTVVSLPPVKYFVGTLLNTTLEWSRFSDSERDKLPFIWLVKPTNEVFNEIGAVERRSDLVLWFVHWSDWTKLNADREEEAIRPLMELVEAFVAAVESNTAAFESYTNYTTKDFPKFATETPQGAENVIFGSTLSAVNMNISINIFASDCINC